MRRPSFIQANKAIIEDIKRELRLQGHYLTGALEASLHAKEITEGDIIHLTAEAAEKGVPANHIEISSATLAAMTKYVQLRMGYQGRKASQVAYRILQKQQEEGMPTKASYQYSKTGDRLDAVDDTFRKNDTRYFDLIDQVTFGGLDTEFATIKTGTI